jgi:hypothetical protein
MKKHAARIDVLITKTRLVEVWLNHVMFPTAGGPFRLGCAAR